MRDTERQAERQAEGEADSLKEPNVWLNPRPQDHALSWRQMLNNWASHPGVPKHHYFSIF